MRRLLLLSLLALSAGCAHTYAVEPLQTDGHYLVVQANMNGSMVVRDCRSVVDGKYEPECVKVRMK